MGDWPAHDRNAPQLDQGAFAQPFDSHSAAAHRPGMAPKRMLSRILIMAGVFAVGITVGLSATRWASGPAPATPAAMTQLPETASAQTPPQEGGNGAIRGISPSELPYDGAPRPPAEAVQPLPESAGGGPGQANTGPYTTSGASAPQSGGSDPLPEMPLDTGMKDATQETETTVARPSGAGTGIQAKPKLGGGEGRAAKKRLNASKVAKDREIERIKKQADHELRRKLDAGRAVEEPGAGRRQLASRENRQRGVSAGMSEPRELRVRKILARCERNRNIFRREQCKWQICNNMWGKNGCPSYSAPSSAY